MRALKGHTGKSITDVVNINHRRLTWTVAGRRSWSTRPAWAHYVSNVDGVAVQHVLDRGSGDDAVRDLLEDATTLETLTNAGGAGGCWHGGPAAVAAQTVAATNTKAMDEFGIAPIGG
jgi:hypothetical protein